MILVNLKIRKMAKISTYPNDAQANYNDKVIGTDATTNATYNYTLQQVNNPTIQRVSTLSNLNDYLDANGVFEVNKFLQTGTYSLDIDFKLNTPTANDEVVYHIANFYKGHNPIMEVKVNPAVNGDNDATLYIHTIHYESHILKRVCTTLNTPSMAFSDTVV